MTKKWSAIPVIPPTLLSLGLWIHESENWSVRGHIVDGSWSFWFVSALNFFYCYWYFLKNLWSYRNPFVNNLYLLQEFQTWFFCILVYLYWFRAHKEFLGYIMKQPQIFESSMDWVKSGMIQTMFIALSSWCHDWFVLSSWMIRHAWVWTNHHGFRFGWFSILTFCSHKQRKGSIRPKIFRLTSIIQPLLQ